MDINKLIRKHEAQREEDQREIEAALYVCGWRSKSSLPGSYWLWSKSFPESKTQWQWQGRGADRRRVPTPPFTINGTTLEIAVRIEAAWQERWDDNRPSANDEREPPASGKIRATCDANGRRWRVEGPGWTMQPEGTLTATEAEGICRAAAHALALNEALAADDDCDEPNEDAVVTAALAEVATGEPAE